MKKRHWCPRCRCAHEGKCEILEYRTIKRSRRIKCLRCNERAVVAMCREPIVNLLCKAHVIEFCDAFQEQISMKVPDEVSEDMATLVAEAYRYRCAVGGPDCAGRLHVHHVKYKSRGGSSRLENLCLLCDHHHTEEHRGRGHGFSLGSHEDEPTEFPYRGNLRSCGNIQSDGNNEDRDA